MSITSTLHTVKWCGLGSFMSLLMNRRLSHHFRVEGHWIQVAVIYVTKWRQYYFQAPFPSNWILRNLVTGCTDDQPAESISKARCRGQSVSPDATYPSRSIACSAQPVQNQPCTPRRGGSCGFSTLPDETGTAASEAGGHFHLFPTPEDDHQVLIRIFLISLTIWIKLDSPCSPHTNFPHSTLHQYQH